MTEDNGRKQIIVNTKAIEAILRRVNEFTLDAGGEFIKLGDFEWADKAKATMRSLDALNYILGVKP